MKCCYNQSFSMAFGWAFTKCNMNKINLDVQGKDLENFLCNFNFVSQLQIYIWTIFNHCVECTCFEQLNTDLPCLYNTFWPLSFIKFYFFITLLGYVTWVAFFQNHKFLNCIIWFTIQKKNSQTCLNGHLYITNHCL